MNKLENVASTDAAAQANANKVSGNFRHSDDIQNFYRFVNENNLRREAKTLLEVIYSKLQVKKKRRRGAKKVVQ
jgi:hypothetical protein